MTYILYNCTSNGVPTGATDILKISEFTTVEETLSAAGLTENDVRIFSDKQFSNAQLYFRNAFRFGPNNTVTFDLEAARDFTAAQVKNSRRFTKSIPGQFSSSVMIAQASLDETNRSPAVQAYFDAINLKIAELDQALAAVAAATNAEVLRAYIDV